MAKPEVLSALVALGGRATRRQVEDYMRAHGNTDIISSVVWQALIRFEKEGIVKFNVRTRVFRLTGRHAVRNIVELSADGTIAQLR